MINDEQIDLDVFEMSNYPDDDGLAQENLFEERINDETLSEVRRNTAKYKYETAVQNINDLQHL